MQLRIECVYVLRGRADADAPWRDLGQSPSLARLLREMEVVIADEIAAHVASAHAVAVEIDTQDLTLADRPNRPLAG